MTRFTRRGFLASLAAAIPALKTRKPSRLDLLYGPPLRPDAMAVFDLDGFARLYINPAMSAICSQIDADFTGLQKKVGHGKR